MMNRERKQEIEEAVKTFSELTSANTKNLFDRAFQLIKELNVYAAEETFLLGVVPTEIEAIVKDALTYYFIATELQGEIRSTKFPEMDLGVGAHEDTVRSFKAIVKKYCEQLISNGVTDLHVAIKLCDLALKTFSDCVRKGSSLGSHKAFKKLFGNNQAINLMLEFDLLGVKSAKMDDK